jgi:hypothetical protein
MTHDEHRKLSIEKLFSMMSYQRKIQKLCFTFLVVKCLVLYPASPSEAGQSANPASQGRMGGTETMWARVVTMRQKLRKVPTESCIHGMYGP